MAPAIVNKQVILLTYFIRYPFYNLKNTFKLLLNYSFIGLRFGFKTLEFIAGTLVMRKNIIF